MAAAAAATTLFALPLTLGIAFGGSGWWWALLAANVLGLVAVAVWRWSPLITLGAAFLTLVLAAVFELGLVVLDTCGHSTTATAVEASGAVALALVIGTWGVLGGGKFIWRFPLAWLAAAAWVVAWAHVIPGGAGGCFE